ncbi:hypothetical protein BATDEDRAFT_36577 [Batrachochytrium dendrobatidis JAM81]|uniref:Superoxide dismutase [Cu-Zn] n=2 Tax=Batrachochytrium dendrobatidis TaxID=109871 RepID=F4NX41_BATDJ|nr:uncharacterized protein BATDEDRAFT_36577 [Batrachochytrium dendrobatidis JAM81]EGF82291.1 hypothetical protein BATDEDRAFT_36577 [Batrachochytrium dendrobatidis JAM81]KAJ8328513.1 hypothetical protein O5D80_003864 [Batrachochytrium dendrobatidis]KAK5666923.1 hypothetical protein QVD99_006145 [Batrachochytrium dendrobatidis]OAJ40047.1 copper/zinc superoxide dismutase (SODC) [Batrachochytrium dendrobatidis JEL423]|eukprot:XP_006676835.1 hypothetical protein BATDEDRAFT_36577 [Batrachochytrium dendrobatidis JAM81]
MNFLLRTLAIAFVAINGIRASQCPSGFTYTDSIGDCRGNGQESGQLCYTTQTYTSDINTCINRAKRIYAQCYTSVQSGRPYCWPDAPGSTYNGGTSQPNQLGYQLPSPNSNPPPSQTIQQFSLSAASPTAQATSCQSEASGPINAIVNIQPDSGTPSASKISGFISFSQLSPSSKISITAKVVGIPAGQHGWHVHAKGNTYPNCSSAGPHWNPLGVDHGAPSAAVRHMGDFGNFNATDDGTFSVTITDSMATLYGPNSILGRALVLHAGVDDLGLTDNPLSKTTGNAGARLACGVIGYQ